MILAGAAAQQPLTGTGAVLTLAVELRSVRRFEQPSESRAGAGIVVMRSLGLARSLSTIFLRRSR
jgi:hypothetical protein